jgi:hypothetical protein
MSHLEYLTPQGLGIFVVEYELAETSPKKTWLVKLGLTLDGAGGFGNPEVQSFSGEALILSNAIITLQKISITQIHIAGLGFPWIIEDIESLPKPPFLIVEDSSTSTIFDGYIKISDRQDIITFEDPNPEGYAVSTQDWFGIILVENGDALHLIAFSNKKNATVTEGDTLWSYEYESLMGELTWISASII